MQAVKIKTACLWTYQYKNNDNYPLSPMSNLSSWKGVIDNTPYLTCTERLSCDGKMLYKATFYCVQCNSLQCILCEKEIHWNSDNIKHERLNLDEEIDRWHPAIFYCPTCTSSFCYACYEN